MHGEQAAVCWECCVPLTVASRPSLPPPALRGCWLGQAPVRVGVQVGAGLGLSRVLGPAASST